MTSFSDDFNRANSTDLGAGWVEVSGDWSIVSSQLSPGAAGGTIILRAAGVMATNDHYAQVTIAATTAASQGVWCRGNSNITSGYLLRNNGSSWDLFSVIGGSFSVIGTYAVAAVAGDVAKVQAVGSTIKAFVNGIERISVTDTGVATGTSVGIRAESTSALRFDDFAAADVVNGATLGIAASTETAQPLAGGKTATLSPAGTTETAQPITAAKTATLGTATASETAQQLVGTKSATLGTALETAAAQTLTGAKTATLPAAAAAETAQPLTAAKTAALGTAAAVEEARPLTGTKSATLSVALEISTARPLIPAGSHSGEVDITVSPPYSPWTAQHTAGHWTAVEAPGPWTAKEAP